jgi:PAS domain S-box-containing protein
MLDDILNNPDLANYRVSFAPDDIIFLEGDDSQELYVLVSGQVAVFKGDKKIRDLQQAGSLFGEVSFFMGGTRTASIRAKSDVTVIRIPKEEVTRFLVEFPSAAREITRHLAQWLDETSQILHGFKEFCDQLPDAVILTDKLGQILAWNSAAENLYGRSWQQMRYASVNEIYEDPQAYGDFLHDVQSQYAIRESVLKIKKPREGIRSIATSMTVLYDGHHNFQGVLSLGRDVTRIKELEKKYKRAGYWLMSLVLLLSFLGAAVFFGYPYITKDYRTERLRRQLLQDYLAKDYFVLTSLLNEHLDGWDRLTTTPVLKSFFSIQNTGAIPYAGLLLLDADRKVVDAYSTAPDADVDAMIGSSYAGINFEGSETSLHKVLTLYRADKNNPMGKKSVEVAFELNRDERLVGWLIFQLDMEQLKKRHGIDGKDLAKLQFEKP